MLLEVARLHAGTRLPRDVNAQFARDGFVVPGVIDLRTAHLLDGLALDAAQAFEPLLLSPLTPLGTCAAVAPSSQHRIVSTLRGTEVVSDPTNVLALECARRLMRDPRADVRLVTVHQVVRAQRFTAKPGMSQHFRMLAMVSAGPALAEHAFEVRGFVEHLGVCLRLMDAWASHGQRLRNRRATLRASDLRRPVATRLLRELSQVAALTVEDAPLESEYYDGVRLQLDADTPAGQRVNVADTGLFDWVARLTSNRRMRMVATGLGLQLLAILFR